MSAILAPPYLGAYHPFSKMGFLEAIKRARQKGYRLQRWRWARANYRYTEMAVSRSVHSNGLISMPGL